MNREDINRLIQDNGLFHGTVSIGVIMDINHLERFAALVAAAEREACAKVCEAVHARHIAEYGDYIGETYAVTCAAAIRARGEK